MQWAVKDAYSIQWWTDGVKSRQRGIRTERFVNWGCHNPINIGLNHVEVSDVEFPYQDISPWKAYLKLFDNDFQVFVNHIELNIFNVESWCRVEAKNRVLYCDCHVKLFTELIGDNGGNLSLVSVDVAPTAKTKR